MAEWKAITALPLNLTKQSNLESSLKVLFPNHKVVKNARKVAHIESSNISYYLELDFWIPDLKLAFEFQDPHHYVPGWFADNPSQLHKHDQMKRDAMKVRGETLINVPCWWDGSPNSLALSIQVERPDLLSHCLFLTELITSPIPNLPPINFFEEKSVPLVGCLMSPSFPLTLGFDPTSWWLSEKYDGVQACWVGHLGALYSRYAKKIEILESVHKTLPESVFIDGELWFGRGAGQLALKLYNSRQPHTMSLGSLHSWEALCFVAFDQPTLYTPFEKRYESLLLIPTSPCTIISPQKKCISKGHLHMILYEILHDEGEGVVVRKQASLYINKRSTETIKIKASRDQEGLVVEKCESDMVLLQLQDGTVFKAKVDQEMLNGGLRQGDIVTFTYESFAGKFPVSPVVSRIRTDLSEFGNYHTRTDLPEYGHCRNGSDLAELERTDLLTFEEPTALSEFRISRTRADLSKYGNLCATDNDGARPRGYWTMDSNINVRAFFDRLAFEKNRDPLVPESWYDISWKEITDHGGLALLGHYNTLAKALADAYPDTTFQVLKFSRVSRNFWNSKENRRRFFDLIAQENGIDPLVPEQWYSHASPTTFSKYKGVWNVLERHNFSYETALIDLYPEIGLSKPDFVLWKKFNKGSHLK
eukprot:Phypoly_transcript_04848.p1 GENE.Phypoly_transcript_04848~~Phypoly_transcript_04848.p1  ORF type:complete len:647 (-),score=68.04 Phypoly_transcript_04848:128-2068(-)